MLCHKNGSKWDSFSTVRGAHFAVVRVDREEMRPLPPITSAIRVKAPLAPTPVDLSETPGRFRRRAPQLGEHTEAILAELGYRGPDIADLRVRGVI